MNWITSFSSAPIRAGTYLGFLTSAVAFSYASYIVGRTMILGVDVPGYASIIAITLFLGGVQLMAIGLLGEYIGRIYKEVKARPVYVVAKTIGINQD